MSYSSLEQVKILPIVPAHDHIGSVKVEICRDFAIKKKMVNANEGLIRVFRNCSESR